VLSYDGQYELEADAERSKEEQQKLKKKLDDIYAMSIKHSDRWKLFLSTLQDAMRSEGKKSSEALAVALKTINTLE
jgi:ribosomal protein L9